MKLIQIQYYLTVAEHMNFTSAAKALYVSQPALSQQISQLEDELGVQLFDRSKKKIQLTPAGVYFRNELQKVMADLERVKNQTILLHDHVHGKLKVGCFDGVVVDDFLPQFYEHVQTRYPDLEISLVRGSFQDMGKALNLDELDLVFTLDWDYKEMPGIQSKVLATRRLSLFYRGDETTGQENAMLQQIQTMPLLLTGDHGSGKMNQQETDILRDMKMVPAGIKVVPGISTLMACLNMGQGFALLCSDSKRYLPHLAMVELPECYVAHVLAIWKSSNSFVSTIMEYGREMGE